VNKDHFIKVLHHYSESSTQEAEDVLLLKKDYPYSQVLHTLSARVSKDHGFSTQQTELQLAAIYAADRTVLKEIMTFELEEDGEETQEIQPAETPAQRNFIAPASSGNDDLATEVIHDLERLHELKHNFEMMFVETVPATAYEPAGNERNVAASDEVQAPTPPTPAPVQATREIVLRKEPVQVRKENQEEQSQREQTKSRKERIIELARARNPVSEPPATPANHSALEPPRIKARPPRKRKEEGDSLIDEIANTKAEIVPENEKQKEQIDLIDQFIKSQPSFANAKEKPNQPVSDLTSIKTGEFADSIVSETLVEILIKQGKKDKAVEVLKKLIWKFPQKKAYFAAQIEELKK
jgi:hypothetical protein